MKKERILAIIMSVFMALSLLPTMVFAAEAGGSLNGKLKIKGTVAVGSTLSADFEKVQPEGMTDENVSFLWSRKTGDQEELQELSREKNYKVADEDLGYKIVLTVTGIEEQGFTGSLTVTSNQVAATAEEAEMLAAAEAGETEETVPEAESVPEESIPEETIQEEPAAQNENTEDASSEEEDLMPIPEPQGDGEEELMETPDDMDWGTEEYDEAGGDDEWSETDGMEEELFPVTVSSSTEDSGMGESAGAEEASYAAELRTEDGSGVLDFGTMTAGTETDVQYVTVLNTGTGTLNFTGISPEHFMVQDIEEPLAPGEEVSLWIQPRAGVPEGTYEDTVTYTSEEGATASFLAKVTVQAAENGEPVTENPETNENAGTDGDDPDIGDPVSYAITAEPAVLNFASLIEMYPEVEETQTVTVTNTGSESVTLTVPELEFFTIAQIDGTSDLSLAAGSAKTFSIQPKAGLPAREDIYGETFVFGIAEDENVSTSQITASVKVEPQSVSVTADPSAITFNTVTEGYGDIPEQTVTLTNQGNVSMALGEITVIDKFEILTNPKGTVLGSGDSASFTIRPKTGLPAGTYTDTVRIYKEQMEDGVLAAVDVSFTVEAQAPVYELAAAPDTLDFGTLEAGYGKAPEAQTITVTNKGNTAVTLKQPGAGNFTVGALGKAVLQPNESTTFTVWPKTGLGENTYEETIQIPANEGISANVRVIFRVTAKTIKLEAIQKPSEITGLKNGTKKTAEALKLPSTVVIQTSNGKMKAKVGWDVKGCSYNSSSTEKQSFTVKGTVTLPDGVTNPKNIGLTVSVKVTVNGYSAKIASKDNNKITGITSDGDYTTQSKISFTAVGAGMDNTKPGKGDTRYLPLNWTVINTNSWSEAPYTATFGLAQSGEYTLSVVFNQQKFDGSNWVNTGEQDTKKVTFTVAKAKLTGVPGQDLTPAAKRTDANRKASVKTGDNTKVAPFVIALIIAAGCVAGVVVYRRKNK